MPRPKEIKPMMTMSDYANSTPEFPPIKTERDVNELPSKVFEKARDLIERGWCKGVMFELPKKQPFDLPRVDMDIRGRATSYLIPVAPREDPKYCAIGAIDVTIGRTNSSLKCRKKVYEQISDLCKKWLGGFNLPAYNDRYETTIADILQVFEMLVNRAKVLESEHLETEEKELTAEEFLSKIVEECKAPEKIEETEEVETHTSPTPFIPQYPTITVRYC